MGRILNSTSLPKYDYVLFDCPPSFTILSYSVLTCCDLVLIPFNPDFFAASGIGLLLAGLRHRIQPQPLPQLRVFANRVPTRVRPTRAAQGWMDDVRRACEDPNIGAIDVRFMDTWIPDRAALRDAITNRQTPEELEGSFKKLWAEATDDA